MDLTVIIPIVIVVAIFAFIVLRKNKSDDTNVIGGGGGKTSMPTGTKEARKPGKVASDNEIQKHIAAASLSVSKAATSKTTQPSKSTLVIPDCSMPSDDSD